MISAKFLKGELIGDPNAPRQLSGRYCPKCGEQLRRTIALTTQYDECTGKPSRVMYYEYCMIASPSLMALPSPWDADRERWDLKDLERSHWLRQRYVPYWMEYGRHGKFVSWIRILWESMKTHNPYFLECPKSPHEDG